MLPFQVKVAQYYLTFGRSETAIAARRREIAALIIARCNITEDCSAFIGVQCWVEETDRILVRSFERSVYERYKPRKYWCRTSCSEQIHFSSGRNEFVVRSNQRNIWNASTVSIIAGNRCLV